MRMLIPPINQPIQVMIGKSNHMPSAFKWRDRTYSISKIPECWRLIGAWWDGCGERTFFRVECTDRSVFEIVYDHGNNGWLLARVED